MPKKRASQKATKKKPTRKPFLIYRQYIVALSVFLLAIGLFVFSRTQAFYFLVSTKEQVDFENATGEYDPKGTVAVFHDLSVPVPHHTLHTAKADIGETNVLGESTSNKRIEVDLTNQRLYAVENGTRVYDFPISSGKPWWATPTGYFKIWIKLRYTRMRGGSQALGTNYDLPNVPYTMFLKR